MANFVNRTTISKFSVNRKTITKILNINKDKFFDVWYLASMKVPEEDTVYSLAEEALAEYDEWWNNNINLIWKINNQK